MKTSLSEFTAELKIDNNIYNYYSLSKLKDSGIDISKLPFSIKILLENLLRHCDGKIITMDDIKYVADWNPVKLPEREIPFMPSRVILQDFTGVPCVADLAAMRNAVKRFGGDTKRVNPLIPVDLVIDHSVQVNYSGTKTSFQQNVEEEYKQNKERYMFLRWAQKAFSQFRIVPPGTGIVHQVNLEYLANVVQRRTLPNGSISVFPDTVIGTDSHTTMINGLGVLGWGVGGIEAEACMLGQPLFFLLPQVLGFKLYGNIKEGVTATDIVLTITQILRKKGVVGKFVEFFGAGLSSLSLPDRATIANMAPEYGATVGFFPVDDVTISFLNETSRPKELIDLVENYSKPQWLFRDNNTPDPIFSETVELDLGTVEPCMAGPKRPQDRILLKEVKPSFHSVMESIKSSAATHTDSTESPATSVVPKSSNISTTGSPVTDGSVVIAAITSCTNTSNPSVMIAAGLLAKKATELGLTVKDFVKTSLAPGSRIVTDYLNSSGLMPYLEELHFHLVGYGCTTCIGNSGPLSEEISSSIKENNLTVAAVLSGNRNFEGRVHPLVKLNYLASPPLVVAYAIGGTIDIDLTTEPIGRDKNGKEIYLKDIWPSQKEINKTINSALNTEMFRSRYAEVFKGDTAWNNLPAPEDELYSWDSNSTYILEPPFLTNFKRQNLPLSDITNAYVLAFLGDSVTTDHISPAGNISSNSPAGRYLQEHGVTPKEFNSFGARRGNHEVMIRGTFGNIRLKNFLVPETEGGVTIHFPSNTTMSIFDAAMKYKENKFSLIVIAGKEYGSGSSRDWAAKGTFLLGVQAVIAESYERIHRSNLVGMGVLPIQFKDGENAKTLDLTGKEVFEIIGIADNLTPGKLLTINARTQNGKTITFNGIARLDSLIDVEYYKNGGILPTVLHQIIAI